MNCDGLVDEKDYNIWSVNVGFDNGLGVGDFTTFPLGDVDFNGRVDFFDYVAIAKQVRGGFAVASALTLFLTPVLYDLLQSDRQKERDTTESDTTESGAAQPAE